MAHDGIAEGSVNAKRHFVKDRRKRMGIEFPAMKQGADTEIVQFDNVGLRYGTDREVLSDLSFTLYPGSFYFLTGASGAGKTSLLKLLYLAMRPSRGAIRMFGADAITLPRGKLPELRRRIGVVFQDFRLVSHLSAYDNVALPLRVSGFTDAELHKPVSDMLEWVGLAGRMNARPATLSGGEQQRVAIARAIIGRPQMLVADEPTGNVDPDMAVKLLRLFEALNRQGTTVVVATHDVHLLRKVPASLIMRLDDGRLFDPTGALRYPPNRGGR
jgi:cell division transport system ATP-binding protein